MTPELLLEMQEMLEDAMLDLSTNPFRNKDVVAREYYTQGFEDAVKLLMENQNLITTGPL